MIRIALPIFSCSMKPRDHLVYFIETFRPECVTQITTGKSIGQLEKLFSLFPSEKFVSVRKVLFDCSHGELSIRWRLEPQPPT